jgi:hypothetical protein
MLERTAPAFETSPVVLDSSRSLQPQLQSFQSAALHNVSSDRWSTRISTRERNVRFRGDWARAADDRKWP